MPVCPTAPVAVLALTRFTVGTAPVVVFNWSPLRDQHDAICFDAFSDEDTDDVAVDIESSADGITPDQNFAWELVLHPREHKHLPVPNTQMPEKLSQRFWMVSAYKKTGVGTAQVRCGITGWRRQ